MVVDLDRVSAMSWNGEAQAWALMLDGGVALLIDASPIVLAAALARDDGAGTGVRAIAADDVADLADALTPSKIVAPAGNVAAGDLAKLRGAGGAGGGR